MMNENRAGNVDKLNDLPDRPDNIASGDDNSVIEEDGNIKTSSIKKKAVKKEPRAGQLVYWFFTWNNYPVDAVETLLKKFKGIAKRWVFQKEIGKETGTPHLQGNIQLWKKMRWSEFKLPTEIHWEKTRNVEAAFCYCEKDDTRDGEDVWIHPTPLKVIKVLRPWQAAVCEMLKQVPDDRTVNWVYDEEGCMGKTVFAKYLYSKHDAIIATGGGNKDIACLLSMLKTNGRDLNALTSFIFNFGRSTEGVSYKAIESVKDGLMTSVKYESNTLVFNCPHVWIFSNERPNMKSLSKDRWVIWRIIDNELINEQDIELDDLTIDI